MKTHSLCIYIYNACLHKISNANRLEVLRNHLFYATEDIYSLRRYQQLKTSTNTPPAYITLRKLI